MTIILFCAIFLFADHDFNVCNQWPYFFFFNVTPTNSIFLFTILMIITTTSHLPHLYANEVAQLVNAVQAPLRFHTPYLPFFYAEVCSLVTVPGWHAYEKWCKHFTIQSKRTWIRNVLPLHLISFVRTGVTTVTPGHHHRNEMEGMCRRLHHGRATQLMA